MITISDNQNTLEQSYAQVANIVADAIFDILKNQPQIVLALTGGRSAAGICDQLVKQATIPWQQVHIFMLDERLVPLTSPDSNFKILDVHLIQPLIQAGKLSQENAHPFMYQPEQEDKGINDYIRTLEQCGGQYDILLASAGEDGHIGALFPNHHSITDPAPYFIKMTNSPKPPTGRMTASRQLIKKAQMGIVVFFGPSKQDAYALFNDQAMTTETCPAKLIATLPQAYCVTNFNL